MTTNMRSLLYFIKQNESGKVFFYGCKGVRLSYCQYISGRWNFQQDNASQELLAPQSVREYLSN